MKGLGRHWYRREGKFRMNVEEILVDMRRDLDLAGSGVLVKTVMKLGVP
jgi:hypothetical protein